MGAAFARTPLPPLPPAPAGSPRASRRRSLSSQSSASSARSRDSGQDLETSRGEAGTGGALLRAVHTAFPLSALWDYRDRLLGSGEGKPRINGRTFSLKSQPGAQALAAFLGVLMAAPLPAADATVPTSVTRIDFCGDYTSAGALELEVDCLLMLPSPPVASWAAATAMRGEGYAALFLIDAPEARTLRALGSQDLPPPPEERRRCGAFSEANYPPGSNMYVLGEVYSPKNRADGLQRSAQKLLQLERALALLCTREGGLPVAQCVLGVVLIGPHLGEELGAAMARTLAHYRQRLPCLWDLQQRGRFLGLRQHDFYPEMAALQIREELASIKAQLNLVQATLALVLERLPPLPAPLPQQQSQSGLGGAAAAAGL